MHDQITSRNLSPELTARLLPKFIEARPAEKMEPISKGISMGDPVGFPFAKYKATLFALRERVLDSVEDLKTQAEELNVSYGLLRKWRSEEGFKDMVAQHQKEFTSYVLQATRGVMIKGAEVSLKARLEMLQRAQTQLEQSRQKLQTAPGKTLSKESVRKLLLLIHADIRDVLRKGKGEANPRDLKEYQLLALDHAIEFLQDRRAATKYRRDIINLLGGVREALT